MSMVHKKIMKKILITLLVICVCGMAILTIFHFRYPASFLYIMGDKVGIYHIFGIFPDISIETIEKEYDKVKDNEEYRQRTLYVAYCMCDKYYCTNNYIKAIPYCQFIYSKDNEAVTYLCDLWICYMLTQQDDKLFDDYEVKEKTTEEQQWCLINSGLLSYLISDSCTLSMDDRKRYLSWLENKMENKMQQVQKDSTTYKMFSYMLENMLKDFLNNV